MGKQGTLTKAEMQVMNILWSLPSMKGTISDVLEGYGEKKPAYTTVATFMKILLNKGYVGFEKLKGTKPQVWPTRPYGSSDAAFPYVIIRYKADKAMSGTKPI